MDTNKKASTPHVVRKKFNKKNFPLGEMPVIRFSGVDVIVYSLIENKEESDKKSAIIFKAVNEYSALREVFNSAKKVQDLTKENYPHRNPEWCYNHPDSPIKIAMNDFLNALDSMIALHSKEAK